LIDSHKALLPCAGAGSSWRQLDDTRSILGDASAAFADTLPNLGDTLRSSADT